MLSLDKILVTWYNANNEVFMFVAMDKIKFGLQAMIDADYESTDYETQTWILDNMISDLEAGIRQHTRGSYSADKIRTYCAYLREVFGMLSRFGVYELTLLSVYVGALEGAMLAYKDNGDKDIPY